MGANPSGPADFKAVSGSIGLSLNSLGRDLCVGWPVGFVALENCL